MGCLVGGWVGGLLTLPAFNAATAAIAGFCSDSSSGTALISVLAPFAFIVSHRFFILFLFSCG